MTMAATVAQALAGEGRARHGAQLALAVLAAYAISASFGLPESLWAVMSALIVVRPNTGTTLSAGWTRLAGTVVGTLAGIAGVWFQHHGASLPAVTLGLVAGLAFASAVVPVFASAPIAALIVLSSTAIPGHSVLQVAGLRGIEVGIGVLTGVAVSLALRGAGATARFDTACAALLRRYAAMLEAGDRASAADTEIRTRLRELAVLAAGADTEARWLHRERSADRHRKLAGLMARLFQDVAVLARLVPAEPTRKAALSALEDAAGAWERRSPLATTPLEDADPTTAGPLRLLVDELRLLVRLRAR
jgi:uncharacterized membrane protein YccC